MNSGNEEPRFSIDEEMPIATRNVARASIWLENVSYLATIFAAIVAIITLSFGFVQFRETQRATRDTLELERESKAVEMFLKYNELMKELAGNPKSKSQDTEFWQSNIAIGIAETIYRLRGDDKGWKETVAWMIMQHRDALKKNSLNCITYDKEFVEFVRQNTVQDVCI